MDKLEFIFDGGMELLEEKFETTAELNIFLNCFKELQQGLTIAGITKA